MPTSRSNVDSGPAATPLVLSGGASVGVVVTTIVVTYDAALQDTAFEAGVNTLVGGVAGTAGGAPGARTLTFSGRTIPLSFDNEVGGLMRLVEGLAKSDRVVSATSAVITLAL